MADSVEMAAPSVVGPSAEAREDAVKSGRKRKPKPPDDFESEYEFLAYVRKTNDQDREADKDNRREMVEDSRFVAGQQWDSQIREARDRAYKPTLTLNRLPAYVAQLIGNRRLNDTGIKIIPDSGGTKAIAKIREGLIRSIQKVCRAQYVFDKAFEQQVIGGLGNFQVHLDYAHDDVFEQDIRIAAIPNPLSVVWDRLSMEPTGADARHVFVTDRLPRKDFEKRYPDAQCSDFAGLDQEVRGLGWDTSDTVQVVSFWRMRSVAREVGLFKDGDVKDITDFPAGMWMDELVVDPSGEFMIREVQRRYAQMYLCSSSDILAGPYDLPVQRVPVFKVPGWEVFVEGDRFRWGMIRFLRDPQKLHNYWRSTIAEKLVGSPKAKWIASSAAVEGREDEWRKSHLSDDPLLIYNAESGTPPIPVPPNQLEPALINEAGVASQDIRDISNIHEAYLGMQSNEVSGKAIMARQRVGEVGHVIYPDNLNMAIEEAGKVINQLIPFVYDTPRLVKTLGPDMVTEKHVVINDETDPSSIDITLGKYSVSTTTGPSYTTRRVEAREEMMAMVNAMPQTMAIAADKIVEAQDWPGADQIAKRIRSQLPPAMLGAEDMDEEEQQAMQAQAQAAQQKQQVETQMLQMEMASKQADLEYKKAQAREAEARAIEAEARAKQAESQAAKNISEIETGQVETAMKMAEQLTPSPETAQSRARDQ